MIGYIWRTTEAHSDKSSLLFSWKDTSYKKTLGLKDTEMSKLKYQNAHTSLLHQETILY